VNDALRLQIGRAVIIAMHWNPKLPEPVRLEIVSRRELKPSQQLSLFDRPEAVQ
jgi:hypothetical protein